MSKSENIKAFEAALNANAELREKYQAALKRIVEENASSSDGEKLVMAAAEVGYTLTIAEFDRMVAETQELDDSELENVAGGSDFNWCWYDFDCFGFWDCSGYVM